MSKSKSTTNTSSNTAQQTTGTNVTTPIMPSWLSTPLQGAVSGLTSIDPSTLVPETSSGLQQTAEANAAGLSGVGSSAMSAAIAKALGLSDAATPTYTADQTGSQGYTAATAAGAGAIPTATYTGAGYTPATMTGATVGAVAPVSGAQISTADIRRLMNPEIDDVVNTTLAGFDRQAATDQAALDAQAGMNQGAFGSSGYALQKSNLTGLNAQNRAATEAGLRSDAYNTALSGATTDANNEQQATLANQATQLQRVLAQAGYDQATATSNQAAENDAGQFGAAAKNTSDATNAAAENSNEQLAAQLRQALGISNAANENQASEFTAAAGNTAALANQGADNAASQSNQSAELSELAQRLQAAMGAGTLGAQENSTAANDAQVQGALGQQQYGQDVAAQQYLPAYYQQLLQALSGVGQTVDGSVSNVSGTQTGQSTGTSTTTSSPSLLSTLLSLSMAGSKIANGGSSAAAAGG